LDAESLYLQLGQLIAEMPTLGGNAPITPEINRWLGRAAHLVTEAGVGLDPVSFTVASDALRPCLVPRRLRRESLITLDGAELTRNFESSPTGVVNQEEMGFRIFANVAERDVLSYQRNRQSRGSPRSNNSELCQIPWRERQSGSRDYLGR
jgi:hypothetical protein